MTADVEAWSAPICSPSWEVHDHEYEGRVRRIGVPGGWLYQVYSGGWSPPTFVPAPGPELRHEESHKTTYKMATTDDPFDVKARADVVVDLKRGVVVKNRFGKREAPSKPRKRR